MTDNEAKADVLGLRAVGRKRTRADWDARKQRKSFAAIDVVAVKQVRRPPDVQMPRGQTRKVIVAEVSGRRDDLPGRGTSTFHSPAYAIAGAINGALDADRILAEMPHEKMLTADEVAEIATANSTTFAPGSEVGVRVPVVRLLEDRHYWALWLVPGGARVWLPRYAVTEVGDGFVRVRRRFLAKRRWLGALVTEGKLAPKDMVTIDRDEARRLLIERRKLR